MNTFKTLLATTLLSSSLIANATPMLRIFELGVKPDQIAQFDAAGKANLVNSVTKEQGTLAMHMARLQDNPEMAYLFEIYQDEPSYQTHINGKFYKDYIKQAPTLLTDHKKFTATNVKFLGEKPQPISVQNNEQYPRLNYVEVWVKPEQNQAFEQVVMEEMATSVEKEDGVLAIYAAVSKDDPTHWYFVEIYADDAAYQSHRNTPHFQRYLSEAGSMLKDRKLHQIGWKLLMSKGGLSANADKQ